MAKAKVQKAEDLFEQELIVGTIGAGATVTETPNLLRGLLGMKFKMVDGYVRPQDVVLAMERGEVEGVCQTVQSFSRAKPEWLKNGTARVLFTAERDPVPGVNAPTVFQFAKTDEQRAILAFTASTLELGRPYMLPPGVPPEVVNAMRRAFDATVNDPLFHEEAAKIGVVITHKTRRRDRGADHEGGGDAEGDHRPSERIRWARETLTGASRGIPSVASVRVTVYGIRHGAPGHHPAV